MRQISAFESIQNIAISALALHSFTKGYYDFYINNPKDKQYPKLQYFFYVLPLIYHEDSLNNFYNSNNLYVVLKDYPQISTQLQNRANKMSKQTFDSLNLAFGSGLLSLNKLDSSFFVQLKRLTYINQKWPFDIDKIIKGSRKLGIMFAKSPEDNLRIKLKVIL